MSSIPHQGPSWAPRSPEEILLVTGPPEPLHPTRRRHACKQGWRSCLHGVEVRLHRVGPDLFELCLGKVGGDEDSAVRRNRADPCPRTRIEFISSLKPCPEGVISTSEPRIFNGQICTDKAG